MGTHNICLFKKKKIENTVKSVLDAHSQKDRKLVFKTNYHLMPINLHYATICH